MNETSVKPFAGLYADFRLIKGRKVVQVVIEIPVEGSNAALEALGGVPRPDKEVWLGLVQVTKAAAVKSAAAMTQDEPDAVDPDKQRKWDTLKPAQQAGIMCTDPTFWDFLKSKGWSPVSSAQEAAHIMRQLLRLKTRADIQVDDPAWLNLKSQFEYYRSYGNLQIGEGHGGR